MLRRLVLTACLALSATLSAPPAEAYKVLCVLWEETIEDMTGMGFWVDGPVPVLPNKACIPMLIDIPPAP